MTPAQKKLRQLEDRLSRDRQRMAEIGLADDLTPETRAELDAIDKTRPDLERQLRAARVAVELEEGEQRQAAAEAGPDAELRERIELRSRASLVNYITAALRGRAPDGAEAELQAAAKVAHGGIPMELWDVPKPEQRADAPTAAPSTVGVNLAPIQPQLFAASVAPRLGVEMPRVDGGTYATATISTGLSAAPKARGTAADSTAATLTVTSAAPKRISARMSLRIEDVAAIGQANFESALRENLASALSDQLDLQMLNGNGTAPNLSGIFNRLTLPSDPSATVDFDAFVASFADGIDGLWASTTREVAILAGVTAYKLSARSFRDSAGGADVKRGDTSFADYAMAHSGGWWTNKRMPAAASGIETAILYRMGGPMGQRAVCPHWGEVGIDDIYSGSASGERYFTLHILVGDVILRQPDAYAGIKYKTGS